MKLISMKSYILKQNKLLLTNTISDKDFVTNVSSYAEFLNIKLKLWMFVPCNKEGKPYPAPETVRDIVNDSMVGAIQWKNFMEINYPNAISKILFKGLQIDVSNKIPYIAYKGNTIYNEGRYKASKRRNGFWFKTIGDLVELNMRLTAKVLK